MTKQRPRRVGLGMKPREVVSANVVQPEEYFEPVPAAVEGDVEGGGLQPSSLQILDSEPQEEGAAAENEPIVAQNAFLEPPQAVPQEAFDTLAALMEKSQEATGANPSFVDPDPREFAGIETTRMITFEEAAKMGLPPVEGADTYVIYRDGVGTMWKSDGKSVSKIWEELNLNPLGELPNGEYRATVRLPEGYVEGVKAQAEADNQSLEDWLTFQLQERLEQWFFAAGAK